MSARQAVLVIGDGGLARETAAVARGLGHEISALLSPEDEEVAVSHHVGKLAIGVGKPQARAAIWSRWDAQCEDMRWEWGSLIHPRADVADSAALSPAVVVMSGALISVDTHLGSAVLLNWNATVGHDTVVGAGSVINPLAAVSGCVSIGQRVLVGAGAVIREGISIGDDATIGAGAVVVKDVPPGAVVVGNPARPIGGVR